MAGSKFLCTSHDMNNPETFIHLSEDETKVVVTHKGKDISSFSDPIKALKWTLENADDLGVKCIQISKELISYCDEDVDEDVVASREE